MAYTTTAEIKGDFKTGQEFGSDTLVKGSDVDQFIVEADALINSYIGAGYTVPVTSGEGLAMLKLLSRSLVVARIKRIMEVKQEKNTDANQNVTGVLLAPSQVMKILSDIKNGEVVLIGAEKLSNGGGFYSANAAQGVEPVVKKDEKQW